MSEYRNYLKVKAGKEGFEVQSVMYDKVLVFYDKYPEYDTGHWFNISNDKTPVASSITTNYSCDENETVLVTGAMSDNLKGEKSNIRVIITFDCNGIHVSCGGEGNASSYKKDLDFVAKDGSEYAYGEIGIEMDNTMVTAIGKGTWENNESNSGDKDQ